MNESLPIIDASETDERALAAEIGRAARGVGFFYLKGHGIDPALVASVFAGAAQFFALPTEVKQRQSIARSPHNRGYVALKGESLDPAKGADLKEAYNIGLDLAADDPRVIRDEPFRGLNLWPDLPGWRDTMRAYFNAVWAVGRRLHRGIALDLGVDRDFFEDKLDRPMAILRLLHYPPQPHGASGAGIGAGEHTDYGSITLLYTDEVGGLEVKRRDKSGDGGGIAAPHVPGAFICNVGDCLPSWGVGTGGTRFARFPGPGEPRDIFDKLDDCAAIHQPITAVTPPSPSTSRLHHHCGAPMRSKTTRMKP